jgi:hypothetical protein
VFRNNPRDKQEIGTSATHFNVPATYLLDFKIEGTPYIGLAEFDTFVNTITLLIIRHGVKNAELKKD